MLLLLALMLRLMLSSSLEGLLEMRVVVGEGYSRSCCRQLASWPCWHVFCLKIKNKNNLFCIKL